VNSTRENSFDLILNAIAHETRRSGLPREHCEKLMFDSISARCFSEEEKAFYVELLNVVMDRAFSA
jgi:hypothetical protein